MKKKKYFLKFISALYLSVLFIGCNYVSEKNLQEEGKTLSNDSALLCKSGPGIISHFLTVTGDVKKNLVLTVDSLMKMNVKHIDNYITICQTGNTDSVVKTYDGVLLKDILEKAILNQLSHKDRAFYFVINATDNYKAVFSWGEIFNNLTGENVFVVFRENGEPIKEKGEMKLICTSDIKTGPRHIYWLKEIKVCKIK